MMLCLLFYISYAIYIIIITISYCYMQYNSGIYVSVVRISLDREMVPLRKCLLTFMKCTQMCLGQKLLKNPMCFV